MTAEKPVPCPVCGQAPFRVNGALVYIACGDMFGDHYAFIRARTHAAAIAAWNRAYGGKNAKAE